ncbi:hypothetical protein LINPERPRIM_LOCUS20786 [Linum perenne]
MDLEEFVHDLYKCSSVAKAYSYDVPTLVGNKHALMPLDTPYFHHQEGGFLGVAASTDATKPNEGVATAKNEGVDAAMNQGAAVEPNQGAIAD